MAKTYVRVLTIAGSDSGGGAGIQADLKTFAALGCYGMSAITAVTAQNTCGVDGIFPLPPDFTVSQIAAVLTDIGADAVKVGMLFSAPLIAAVAGELQKHAFGYLVVDPVMVAQSGDRLLEDNAVEALRRHLLPMADVVTPNLPEAEVLAGRRLHNDAQIQAAAREIAAGGCAAVLIKGGHGRGETSDDLLYLSAAKRFRRIPGRRIDTANNHGTGCTLSSAIACYLARGDSTETAVRRAKAYISGAIRAGAGYRIGGGSGPVHHFYEFWE